MNKYYYTFLLFLGSIILSSAQTNNCDHPDYDAIVAINNSMSGLNWNINDCDICSLPGVGCNDENRVELIFMIGSALSGVIPPEIGDLEQLFRLTLQGTSLIKSSLTGEIPPEIGNLKNLITLELDYNQLTGSIPSQIGNLENLKTLSLSGNQLTGNIPSELGNLSKLEGVNLSNNQLMGNIAPELAMIGSKVIFSNIFNNTIFINLSSNNLEGCIPTTFNLFCNSPIPNKFYDVNLTNNPNLTNDDFIQFCSTQAGLCQENNTVNCDALNFKGNEGEITVSGLTPQSTIEIIGRNTNWQIVPICDGNCSETQTISDLMAGEYTVKVQLFGADGTYCYREEKITASSEGGGNTGGSANCDNLIFTGENGQITIEDLTATYNKVEIIGRNTDWQVVTICDGNCNNTQIIPDLLAGEYAVKINQSGNDGSYCYREEKVNVSNGGVNTGGSANCDDLSFTAENGQIVVGGLTATYDKVELIGRNTDWQVVTICDGDCSDTQNIPDLANGEYVVKVNQGGNDGTYCYREEKVVLTNSSSNRNSNTGYSNELVLYPNPVRERINLKFHRLIEKEGTIHIYNAFGQMVQSFSKAQFNNDAVSIDLDGYENGMYLLSVKADNLPVITKRFVVEHMR